MLIHCAGWQMTATVYREKIVEICAKMFAIRPLIHPANRNAVNQYLDTVWKKVATLTSSLVGKTQTDALKGRFQSYVDAEEQRLREGLETFKYDIDAIDTLSLITGPGRIEKVTPSPSSPHLYAHCSAVHLSAIVPSAETRL